MIKVTKCIEWDMGHRVPNHKSKCRNPHGHRYKLELTVGGDINQITGDSSEGMVIDFGDIKKLMMEFVHDVLDHGFMIYKEDQILIDFFMLNEKENFKYTIVPFIPTVENVSAWCFKALFSCLPKHVKIYKVRVYETPNSWADYHGSALNT